MSNIGRKVRITGYIGTKYHGKIGTVTTDNNINSCFIVTFQDGTTCVPYKPGTILNGKDISQCEFVEEQSLLIADLVGKKVAIHTPTEELHNRVREVLDSIAATREKTTWLLYEQDTCLDTESGDCSSVGFYKRNNYQIIEAKDLLKANEKQTIMKSIQEQLQELKDQIAKLEQQVKEEHEFKVGDWVVVTGNISRPINPQGKYYKVGDIDQVTEAMETSSYLRIGKSKGSNNIRKVEVRKATPEEIRKATEKPKEIIVIIGKDKTPIKVSKSKIVAPDGKEVDPDDLKEFIDDLRREYDGIPWTITQTIKIGCAEGIVLSELEAVQKAYEELNN